MPIYEALVERDVHRDTTTPAFEGTLVLELRLQPNAPFEGKRVRELGLPPGCMLVTLRRGMRVSVPHADTRLEADDRITAVIAAEAAPAVLLLRQGCDARPTIRQHLGTAADMQRDPEGSTG
jgi:Trk K+ transport system NAD-binding subunit